jgi:hypothetical protein
MTSIGSCPSAKSSIILGKKIPAPNTYPRRSKIKKPRKIFAMALLANAVDRKLLRNCNRINSKIIEIAVEYSF